MTIEDQRKNQINAIKESGKQIIESNEVTKNDFNTDISGVSHEKKKEIFDRLVEERVPEFSDTKDKTDPNNLVYAFKTGGNEPKDFGNYQMPQKLFDILGDGDINLKGILKIEQGLNQT